MFLQDLKKSIKFYANVCLGSIVLLSAPLHASSEEAAGTVTFMLGKAFLNGETPVTVGTKVGAGDSVETLTNGHVHIRFVDNGLVSIRPESRLLVEHYDYNVEQPTESVIKFNLDQGVMRSISGEGAKSARDKFRLNTPIAAIGVRGTDFVVKASNDLLQAIVNEGAIVVAPFSSVCQAATTGPCQGNVVELTGDANQLLEFSSLYNVPRLIPLADTFASDLLEEQEVQLQQQSAPENLEESTLKNEDSNEALEDDMTLSGQSDTLVAEADDSESSSAVTAQTSRTVQVTTLAEDGSVASTTELEVSAVEPTSENTMSLVVNNPDAERENDSDTLTLLVRLTDSQNNPLITEAPVSDNLNSFSEPNQFATYKVSQNNLAWGRWTASGNTGTMATTDKVVFNSQEIKQGREIITSYLEGTSGLSLYRKESELSALNSELGKVDFNLLAAQATLLKDDIRSAMTVLDGRLSVNFNERTFATSVALEHPLTSAVDVSFQGTINSQGMMFSSGSNDIFRGATTLEGDASSYLFYKDVDAGTIEGVTYWLNQQ